MAKIKVLALDVLGAKGFIEKEIEGSDLENFYDLLKCRCFDIATRQIKGKYFDIFCDDEGLFVDKPMISAFDSGRQPALVGNLIFTHTNSMGETIGISDDDIEWIKKHAVDCEKEDKQWKAVYPLDY